MADVARTVDAGLEEQVRRLTEENERLRSNVEAERRGPTREPRHIWRGVLVVVLLVLATVLAPAATVAGWARVQLTSADTFVDTFAPLADDPNVQALVTDQAVAAINSAVDIPGLTNDVFTGIDQIGLPPRAAAALKLLQTPATQGSSPSSRTRCRTSCAPRPSGTCCARGCGRRTTHWSPCRETSPTPTEP